MIDTFLTVDASQALLDWIIASGKNLTTIYVTHGHADHFFGIALFKRYFPNARAVGRPDVMQAMFVDTDPACLKGFWNTRFPGQIPGQLEIAESLEENSIDLKGMNTQAFRTRGPDA
ncbi:MBL fold metallo-hydrolase [Pseudomonas sp. ADAK18]|nr:MBL fold metallo-hydrolase [Pseudomonas sp. ADAK18]